MCKLNLQYFLSQLYGKPNFYFEIGNWPPTKSQFEAIPPFANKIAKVFFIKSKYSILFSIKNFYQNQINLLLIKNFY